jgi:hypothetical protein
MEVRQSGAFFLFRQPGFGKRKNYWNIQHPTPNTQHPIAKCARTLRDRVEAIPLGVGSSVLDVGCSAFSLPSLSKRKNAFSF